jgi:hypothetical protein
VKRFLTAHKRLLKTVGEAITIELLWTVLRAAGIFGAGVAAAATIGPGLIDLSNNNGGSAAVAIAAPGVQAVESKATEGLRFRDPFYPSFRAAAAKHHRAFGGYVFLHPDLSGTAQADYFLAYAQPRRGDLEPVVDSETGSPYAAARATYAALHELERHGYRPLLYASSSYLGQLVRTDPRLKGFRVWQAEYGPTLHFVAGVHVVAWQFTDRARVAGFSIDGSHLLVRSVRQLEWKPKARRKPRPAPPPCQLWRPGPRPRKALCTIRPKRSAT